MKVMVTGADGFIGRAVCLELEKKSHEVIRLVRKDVFENRVQPDENKFVADICDKTSLKQLEKLTQIDAVVHTAGLAHQFGKRCAEDFRKVNVSGTQNISELAIDLGAKQFIHISSVAVYGNVEGRSMGTEIDESTECQPSDMYGMSKLESEEVCQKILGDEKIHLTILRLATVIGEEDKGNLLRLIRAIDRRRFIWVGNGKNRKSLIYRRDVAKAIILLLTQTHPAEIKSVNNIYNLSAQPVPMKDIVKNISDNLNKRIFPVHIPAKFVKAMLGLAYSISRIKRFESYRKTLNKWLSDETYTSKKFKREYNFRETYEPCEALSREVKWYLEQK